VTRSADSRKFRSNWMRSPPQNIEILLPVWGERYTRDFLELCLPSLLAPGNLPALSKLARCTFVLLAPVRDVGSVEQSPLWPLLLGCCSIRVKYIDDLVSQSSSTVLTLAYAWAIRESDDRAMDTCFVPLVADYVISDGSLLAVVERIFAGASGVLAGNFQLTREIAFPFLEKRKNGEGILAIPPQALVALSFKALHPATLSAIINESQGLKPETNRLFWRVDDQCMLGRFFLMHMIAIRPETSDFVITAPSDYSLIPELCPSGNIVRITDSDEYFVVECQPQSDGPQDTASSRVTPHSFAKGLATWATAMHRDNARHPVIFHGDRPSPRLVQTMAASEAFVSEVEAGISYAAPLPFRNHPLWRRALDYHVATAQAEQDPTRLATITGDTSLARGLDRISRPRSILLGRAPRFRPWHPRWPDVQMLKLSLAAMSGDVAIVSDAAAQVRNWLDQVIVEGGGRSTTHIKSASLSDTAAKFDSLVLISDQVPTGLAEILPRLALLVRANGAVVWCIGRVFSETEHELTSVSVPSELVVANGNLSLVRTTCVTRGAWRVAIQTAMMQYARKSTQPTSFMSLCWIAAAGGLAALGMFFNIGARLAKPPKRSKFSSVVFTFCKAGN
jgi:hypothetical protein